MGRWARSQSYLFWACAVGALTVIVWMAIDFYGHDPHHTWMLIVIGVLFLATLALYATKSRLIHSLRQSQERYRLFMDEASDPIINTDLLGVVISINRRAMELTGYSAEELVGMHSQELLPPGYDVDEERIVDAVGGGNAITFETAIVTKAGATMPVEVSVTLLSDALVQSIVRPIAERKAVEDALRRSEAVFRAVSELTSDYAYSMKVEPDGSLTPEWLTGAYERVTGYTVEESHEHGGWQALVHPDDVPAMAEQLAESMQSGGSGEAEFRIIAKSGEIKRLKAWSRFERDDPDGPVTHIVGAVSDITEQKLLENELRQSERRHADLYNRLPIGIFRRAVDGTGLAANPAIVEICGYPSEEAFLEADPVAFWVDPVEREKWLSNLRAKGVVKDQVLRFKRYDGTPFWARMTARYVVEGEGETPFIEGAVVDITEEKLLDEELRATLADLRRAGDERRRLLTHLVKAKEEERNRVASDIHDDSVQVMTSVAIDLERLSRGITAPDQRRALEQLESRVRDAIGRLRTMVFELRPPTLEEEGVGSALRLYLEEFSIDSGIAHDMRNLLEDEPANPTRVVLYRIAQEALTNVRKHSGASNVVVDLARLDGGIAMTVSDDGIGFDVAAVTEDKSPGHIGLSEMRERAEMADGSFEVSSRSGGGTTIRAWIPELAG